MNGLPGFHDAFLTRHNEQRYLLQLGFVDRLVGRLLRRLKAQGMYDNTLHGGHGRPRDRLAGGGVETRRSVNPSQRRGAHARCR